MRKVWPAAVLALVCVAGLWLAAPVGAASSGRAYEMVTPSYKGGYGVRSLRAVASDGEGVAFESQGGFAGVLSFAGEGSATYLARRGESSWSTTGEMPPPSGGTIDFSADLRYALGKNCTAPNAGTEQYDCKEENYLLHEMGLPDLSQYWELAGQSVKRIDDKASLTLEESASPDLCHVVIGRGESGALTAEAQRTNNQIYDLATSPAAGCASSGAPLQLVAVKNKIGLQGEPEVIDRTCTVEVGLGLFYSTPRDPTDDFNAVADHGGEIFFTTGLEKNCATVNQLYVRVGKARTFEISRPLDTTAPFGGCGDGGGAGEIPGEVPCPGAKSRASAYFKGASEDGKLVFFTTEQPLVPEDKDNGNDLYLARIGCPAANPACTAGELEVRGLVMVSADPNEVGLGVREAAKVQGVVAITPDGSRIYFVARGDLLSQAEREALAAKGREVPQADSDNLYAYDSRSSETRFVARLCSGPALSGVNADLNCPPSLSESNLNDTELLDSAPPAQVNWCSKDDVAECSGANESGRYLIFASYARLSADDANDARDVYRYDAQTGSLERVSIGEGGFGANGNDEGDASIADGPLSQPGETYKLRQMGTRALTEDGSRIVFMTSRPLSPRAVNGLTDIYEWHEGTVSLVSSGSSEAADSQAVMTPSGRDLFFSTRQGLLPQDTDGLDDIYDARVGGGFPSPTAPLSECSADACQGPLTNPAPLLVPGSAVSSPGENLRTPKKLPAKPKKKHKRRKRHRAKRAAHARTPRTSSWGPR